MHVAQFLALRQQRHHIVGQGLQGLGRIADQLHLHALIAAAAIALVADAVVRTRRARQGLADLFQQRRQLLDLARVESHGGAAAFRFAEPRIDLGDVVLVAIGLQVTLDPPHLLPICSCVYEPFH